MLWNTWKAALYLGLPQAIIEHLQKDIDQALSGTYLPLSECERGTEKGEEGDNEFIRTLCCVKKGENNKKAVDEALKGIDPALVAEIEKEIVSTCQDINWDDIGMYIIAICWPFSLSSM